MKIVIIDDNQKASADLQKKLGKFPFAQVEGIASTGFSVELPDISGLDFLERSSFLSSGECRVIIYTSYDKYILPAFRKRAFDVLLKPIDPKELDTVMERLQESNDEPVDTKQAPITNNNKFLLYTNNVDFTLVDKSDIGLFSYDTDTRCWEALVAGFKKPIKLRRTIKGDNLLALDPLFVQVNQKFIINMNYLVEVTNNVCKFFPPFDKIDYVSVGRIYRKKLREKFFNL